MLDDAGIYEESIEQIKKEVRNGNLRNFLALFALIKKPDTQTQQLVGSIGLEKVFISPKEQKETDLKTLIEDENLNEEETRKFIDNSFRDGQVKITGTDIEKILPPMRRFGGGNRTERKQTIINKVLKFFEKYFGLSI